MLNQSSLVNGLFFDYGPEKETVIMEDFGKISNATEEDASNNEMDDARVHGERAGRKVVAHFGSMEGRSHMAHSPDCLNSIVFRGPLSHGS
jgi:hypothetical protein